MLCSTDIDNPIEEMIEMHTLQPIPPTSTELGTLISHGKQRGYVTADEVQHAVPAAEEADEALDVILDNLNKNGIRIIDEETDAPVVIDEDFGNEHYDRYSVIVSASICGRLAAWRCSPRSKNGN